MEYKLSSEVCPLPLILHSSQSIQLKEYLCVILYNYVCMKIPREKCEGGRMEAGRAATRVYKTGTQLREPLSLLGGAVGHRPFAGDHL